LREVAVEVRSPCAVTDSLNVDVVALIGETERALLEFGYDLSLNVCYAHLEIFESPSYFRGLDEAGIVQTPCPRPPTLDFLELIAL
jgi:hypothetical protein